MIAGVGDIVILHFDEDPQGKVRARVPAVVVRAYSDGRVDLDPFCGAVFIKPAPEATLMVPHIDDAERRLQTPHNGVVWWSRR